MTRAVTVAPAQTVKSLPEHVGQQHTHAIEVYVACLDGSKAKHMQKLAEIVQLALCVSELLVCIS